MNIAGRREEALAAIQHAVEIFRKLAEARPEAFLPEYLGRALANYPHAVVANARVEAAPSGYRLELALVVDGRHERHELAGPDCDQLGRDVALLIASAVDP